MSEHFSTQLTDLVLDDGSVGGNPKPLTWKTESSYQPTGQGAKLYFLLCNNTWHFQSYCVLFFVAYPLPVQSRILCTGHYETGENILKEVTKYRIA